MPKRLVKGEKKIFGVCSGIANYFDIDPTIVRVLFVFGFLVFGSGLLLYLILAIAM
ncbi:MAG: PspC domain-containing protein, partial [Chitinophagales bacterium]|nr:PspC domain-containing protein [Chitinophagales bacterium]